MGYGHNIAERFAWVIILDGGTLGYGGGRGGVNGDQTGYRDQTGGPGYSRTGGPGGVGTGPNQVLKDVFLSAFF